MARDDISNNEIVNQQKRGLDRLRGEFQRARLEKDHAKSARLERQIAEASKEYGNSIKKLNSSLAIFFSGLSKFSDTIGATKNAQQNMSSFTNFKSSWQEYSTNSERSNQLRAIASESFMKAVDSFGSYVKVMGTDIREGRTSSSELLSDFLTPFKNLYNTTVGDRKNIKYTNDYTKEITEKAFKDMGSNFGTIGFGKSTSEMSSFLSQSYEKLKENEMIQRMAPAERDVTIVKLFELNRRNGLLSNGNEQAMLKATYEQLGVMSSIMKNTGISAQQARESITKSKMTTDQLSVSGLIPQEMKDAVFGQLSVLDSVNKEAADYIRRMIENESLITGTEFSLTRMGTNDVRAYQTNEDLRTFIRAMMDISKSGMDAEQSQKATEDYIKNMQINTNRDRSNGPGITMVNTSTVELGKMMYNFMSYKNKEPVSEELKSQQVKVDPVFSKLDEIRKDLNNIFGGLPGQMIMAVSTGVVAGLSTFFLGKMALGALPTVMKMASSSSGIAGKLGEMTKFLGLGAIGTTGIAATGTAALEANALKAAAGVTGTAALEANALKAAAGVTPSVTTTNTAAMGAMTTEAAIANAAAQNAAGAAKTVAPSLASRMWTGAKSAGKFGLKSLPFIGAGMFSYDAYNRYMEGDTTGAMLAMGGAGASFIPGLGGLIGTLGVSGANGLRDINKNVTTSAPVNNNLSYQNNITKNINAQVEHLSNIQNILSKLLDVQISTYEHITTSRNYNNESRSLKNLPQIKDFSGDRTAGSISEQNIMMGIPQPDLSKAM